MNVILDATPLIELVQAGVRSARGLLCLAYTHIAFFSKLDQAGDAQAVIKPGMDVIQLGFGKLNGLALAQLDGAGLAFECSPAAWAGFLFVFMHGLSENRVSVAVIFVSRLSVFHNVVKDAGIPDCSSPG